eukprot:5617436-Prorocentrum_lima.AAC.1
MLYWQMLTMRTTMTRLRQAGTKMVGTRNRMEKQQYIMSWDMLMPKRIMASTMNRRTMGDMM